MRRHPAQRSETTLRQPATDATTWRPLVIVVAATVVASYSTRAVVPPACMHPNKNLNQSNGSRIEWRVEASSLLALAVARPILATAGVCIYMPPICIHHDVGLARTGSDQIAKGRSFK